MERGERELLLKKLIDWGPSGGILSVYVEIDPADRGQGWRIALRDRLRELAERTPPHDERRAFEAAARRVFERFPENAPAPPGRGHAGFVEVAEKPTEVWRSMQVAPRGTEVVHLRRPYLRPLVEMFDDGPRVGVVLVSAERVRLLEWSLGTMRELEDWEIVLWSLDWREQKAERAMPGQHQGISASGRDQFGQRLEANRRRFLREVGELVATRCGDREWRHSTGAALGPQAVLEALAQGRVRHLIFDADRDYEGRPFDGQTADAGENGDPDVPVAERMVELAVATGADITPVEDGPASKLGPHDGAAALLRY